jgi:Tfp pilus assembly protein FimT
VIPEARLKETVLRGTRSAYTLFEVVLACGVLVVVASISLPVAQSLFAKPKMTAATDFVKARWAEAKNLAREEGRPYKFGVKANTGQFRIAPDSPEFWDGGNLDTAVNPVGTVKEGTLDEDVQFCQETSAAGGDWLNAGAFWSDGSPKEDVEIAFGKAGERPVRLRLSAASGAVSTLVSP